MANYIRNKGYVNKINLEFAIYLISSQHFSRKAVAKNNLEN
ncbi:MAG: hypothetical protein ABIL39_11165 [candidate division WOR-3 bacterium]